MSQVQSKKITYQAGTIEAEGVLVFDANRKEAAPRKCFTKNDGRGDQYLSQPDVRGRAAW